MSLGLTMFKLLSELAVAWNQAGLLAGGGFFAAISALLLGNRLYWRVCASHVDGTIVGVRKSGAAFYPVYRYDLATGPVEAVSDTGSGTYQGMSTGRAVRLMVFPGNPNKVSAAGSFLVESVSVVLLAASSWIIYLALTQWPVNLATVVVLLGLVGYLGVRGHSVLSRAPTQMPGMIRLKSASEDLAAAPLLKIEDLAPASAGSQNLAQQSPSPPVRVLLIGAGCLLLVLSAYLVRDLLRLQSHGQRARGQVIEVRPETDASGNALYRAIVQFNPAGTPLAVADRVRSNPPSYRVGDQVTVIYQARFPERTARIDRGTWNWLPPGVAGLFGALLLLAGLRNRSGGGSGYRMSQPAGS